jgi:choline dehydrogenase-like flavoprotein
MPGHPANYGAELFEQAAQGLGLNPYPTPVAINNGPYDGRPGCSYCGFCSSHGCPIGAKGDTRVTALAKAMKTGRVEIRAGCNAYRVEMSKGRARRVAYFDPGGRSRSVSARAIVLACSPVDTPRLALLSEWPFDLVNHDLLGRYLMVHHYPGGIGFFEQRIDYYRGFWSMRCLDDFYLGDPVTGQRIFGLGNIQTVGPSSGYPVGAGGIISTGKLSPWGAGHKEFMRRVFGHVQFVGMVGQDAPVKTNRVDLDPTVTDIWGLPAARVTYQHHPNDYAVTPIGTAAIAEILTAMGAVSTQTVIPFSATTSFPQLGDTAQRQRGPGRGIPETIAGMVVHQAGTMRMGSNPDDSVVDPWGRFWGVPNMYVADGSVLPTSGGYNPTLTIQAMAWRIAEGIARTHR